VRWRVNSSCPVLGPLQNFSKNTSVCLYSMCRKRGATHVDFSPKFFRADSLWKIVISEDERRDETPSLFIVQPRRGELRVSRETTLCHTPGLLSIPSS
jgi:hypothetical protein